MKKKWCQNHIHGIFQMSTDVDKCRNDDILTLVDVDISKYRNKYENRTVKKNCTIPYCLNADAEKAGINFSQLLQEALKQKLYG